jgi:hypothetical protein
MIWKIITGGITSLVGSYIDYRKEKLVAKTAVQTQIAAGQIDYNVAAQEGMAASIKDEFLVIWTTGLVTLHFFPQFQPYLESGWNALANIAPDWFGYCFVGMYVAVFGLKGWKIFANNGGKK